MAAARQTLSDDMTTAVKERPILFSGPMVRAILDGRKTQTRRALNPQPTKPHYVPFGHADGAVGAIFNDQPGINHGDHVERYWCKWQPGERAWIRETWDWVAGTTRDQWKVERFERKAYKADGCLPVSGKWHPSIHMPRWMSRITLEITDVRVQRLHDISAKDILAEGAVERAHHDQHLGKMPVSAFDKCAYVDLASLWSAGWDSINKKKHPWASNPWVWAISFKRI